MTTDFTSQLATQPALRIPTLAGKRILLGVTGSIAAYKAADICSQLGKLGADVHVVLTESASRFIGEATLQALTRNRVITDLFDEPTAQRIAHIDHAQSADLVLIAPATADILARMAHGIANDMLSTCLLATPPKTPVLVAPAMNTVMWEHPATVANLQMLRQRAVIVVSPQDGQLACQDVGTGKLAQTEEIVAEVERILMHPTSVQSTSVQSTSVQSASVQNNQESPHDGGQQSSPGHDLSPHPKQDLLGKRLLITAGATREPLDPVRFISNRSSGKMGYALATVCAERGADVVLVTGFATAQLPAHPRIQVIAIGTAREMLVACENHFPKCDIFIAAAAVADYAPETVQPHKIKKSLLSNHNLSKQIISDTIQSENDNTREEIITLHLVKTPDIVATLATQRVPGQHIIGFAAESENLIANAQAKIARKGLDLIVANDILAEGAGFETDTNIVTLLWPDGRSLPLPKADKLKIAHQILDHYLHNDLY